MKIALINPNSTAGMTDKVRAVAENYASAGTEIRATNPNNTPASIEGHYDEAVCVPGLLDELKKAEAWGADGYVVACFDDPGLGACREIVSGPVVGICEAAMLMTSTVATSFSVITTLPRAIPVIERLAHEYGMARFCRKVRAADIPVLDLEHDPAGAKQKIKLEVQKAVSEDGCEAVILGCAGMADLTLELSQECGIPVVDGVLCGLKLAESLVGARLATSKVCAYAPPRKK